MRNSKQTYWPLVLAGLAVLAACGAGNDADSNSSQGLTIHPGGNPTGALVVAVPAGFNPPSAYTLGVYKAADPAKRQINFKMQTAIELDPGSVYCLVFSGTTDCSVQVNAAQTTIYTLGGMRLSYDDASVFTELGSLAVKTLKADTQEAFNGGFPWATSHSGGDITLYLALAGQYEATFVPEWTYADPTLPLPAPQFVSLAQGQILDWNVQVPEWRFRANLIVPQRQYPDVQGYQTLPNNGDGLVTSTYVLSDGRGQMVSYPTFQNNTVLQLPPASPAGNNYTLTVFGTALTIPAGAADTQTDITISRIDMDDVAYTLPDGTPATTPGIWTATRTGGAPGPAADTALLWQLGYTPYTGQSPYWEYTPQTSFPTAHGLDVIEGTYNGTITYNLQDLGGVHTDQYSATF